jgi:hypothetical protein
MGSGVWRLAPALRPGIGCGEAVRGAGRGFDRGEWQCSGCVWLTVDELEELDTVRLRKKCNKLGVVPVGDKRKSAVSSVEARTESSTRGGAAASSKGRRKKNDNSDVHLPQPPQKIVTCLDFFNRVFGRFVTRLPSSKKHPKKSKNQSWINCFFFILSGLVTKNMAFSPPFPPPFSFSLGVVLLVYFKTAFLGVS